MLDRGFSLYELDAMIDDLSLYIHTLHDDGDEGV